MTKEEFVEFLKNKNWYSTVEKRSGKYRINNSSWLSLAQIHQVFMTRLNVRIDQQTFKETLSEIACEIRVKEKDISDRLAKELNGQREVKINNVGLIDVLTVNEIIEVKEYRSWKGALGQVLSYSQYYPNHRKRLHLFGEPTKDSLHEIYKICKTHDVKLTYESVYN